MKKYLKNKYFIPEDFYKQKELGINRSEKNIIAIFIIINLLFIPFTSEKILNLKENNSKEIVNVKNIKQNVVGIYDVKTWLECIARKEIEEAHITMNEGEILVSNFNEINKIGFNELIKINYINLDSDNKYKLGVSLSE